LFAVAYGANNAQVGQLTAVASLCGMIALLPGARAIGAMGGRRKGVVIWSGGIVARLPLLALAALPFMAGQAPASNLGGALTLAPITVMILANALITFGTNFANPGWTAIVADIVPRDIRGRFFSYRNLAVNLPTLLIVPLAGWLIQAGNRPGAPMAGYQLIFLLAFITGAASTYAFGRIDDPQPQGEARKGLHWREVAGTLRSAPGFLSLVVVTLIWNLGVQIIAPFLNIYLVNDLGGDTAMVGWVTAASGLTTILTLRPLGRLVDRKGNVWVQGVFSFIIPLIPIAWMLARAPWQVLIINGVSGILWAAYGLANFNLLLDLAPEPARAEATALFQFVVAGSAVIAPIIGGHVADAFGYQPVFIMSFTIRLLGALAFVWWVARPVGRRGAIREA
jgi:MFS family permease